MSSTQPAQPSWGPVPPAPDAPEFYPLRISEGDLRLRAKGGSEGIEISAAGISWRRAGTKCDASFAEIERINLRFASTLGHSPKPCVCRIVFCGRAPINVSSASFWGLDVGGERAAAYRRFVLDLHGRLDAALRARITFIGGNDDWKALAKKFALYGAVLGVVAPIAWIIFTGESPWFFGAAAMGLAIFFSVGASGAEARSSSPTAIPERLFP